jgi:PEP-utilizing family enzyme
LHLRLRDHRPKIRAADGLVTGVAAFQHGFVRRRKLDIAQVIHAAHAAGRKIGICGRAPSDYPEFARFLMTEGIDSLSLNPDSLLKTMLAIVELEQRQPSRQRVSTRDDTPRPIRHGTPLQLEERR